MSFDDELERRLTERANETFGDPDLIAIESAAGSRRSRRRLTVAVSTAAVTALAVVGVMVVTPDRPETEPAASETNASPGTTAASGTAGEEPSAAPVDTTDAAPGSTLPSVDAVADSAPGESPAAVPTPRNPANADDPAAPFLARTTEIYRRTIGDQEIIVRKSDVSWADFFGLEWPAPTGSAAVCMGDTTLLVGNTDSIGPSGSMWEPIESFAAVQTDIGIDQSMFGEFAVAHVSGETTEVALLNGNGEEIDRAPVAAGLAVLVTRDMWGDESTLGEPAVVLISDGAERGAMPYWEVAEVRSDQFDAECRPEPFPGLPLPPAGAQPDDPVAAEAEIRTRHALAVDRSITLEDDPPGLVDDQTGIAEATAEVDAGQYADVAASAEHTIGDLVFTAPDEAWFEYTITTSSGEIPGRHGIARFNGSVWQITRDTICQDLATAGGTCVPVSEPNQPPEPEGWTQVMAENDRIAQLYFEHRSCLPPPFDQGWCLTSDQREQDALSNDGG